jgi:hypothetical protein
MNQPDGHVPDAPQRNAAVADAADTGAAVNGSTDLRGGQ